MSEAVLVDLGGEIWRFDLATGTVLWQHNIGSDVNVPPAAGAGLVVIMDRGGTTTAFEQGDRSSIVGTWRCRALLRTVIGDNVVVIQDQTAHALSTTTGTAPLGTVDLRDADRHGELSQARSSWRPRASPSF